MSERRFKIMTVPARDLCDLFSGRTRITNIPDGAEITGAAYAFDQDAFQLRVEHPSFDSVNPGILAPDLMAQCEHVPTAVAREREACAKIAHELVGREQDDLDVAEEIEFRIRARGNQ